MKSMRRLIFLSFLALAALSCSKDIRMPGDSDRSGSCFIDGAAEIRVSEELAAQIERDGIPQDFLDAGVTSLERIFPEAGEWEQAHREAGLHRWYKLTLHEKTKASDGSFSQVDGIEKAEPLRRIRHTAKDIAGFPLNDPNGRRYQWHILNDGQQWTGYRKGADLNVAKVFRESSSVSKEIIVAIVDSGIDHTHPELASAVIPFGEGGSRNFVSNDYSPLPGEHGTHVAGIIGAVGNNGEGICGVAGGTDGKGGVRLLSCITFGSDDKQNGNFAEAIVYAADHGALICNCSWCYEYDSLEEARNGSLPTSMKQAIDYFISHAGCDAQGHQTAPMKGGVVIFSAGNNGWDYGLPAAYEPVIAVGAIGPDGRKSSYSNYGSWVDICAPGGEKDRFADTAAKDGSSYILSTAVGGKYMFMCGTSQACPMVSGVAALAISTLGKPGFTCEDLRSALLSTATDDIVPAGDGIGPLVNAYGAVNYGNSRPSVRQDAASYIAGRSIPEGSNPEVVLKAPGETLTLDARRIFEDADGDPLTYSIASSDRFSMETEGGMIKITASRKGSDICRLSASDPKGARADIIIYIGVFDDSCGPAVFPNPAGNGYFCIGVGERKPVSVDIYNLSGSLLLHTEAESSVFEPLRIELEGFAPGRYLVQTQYGKKQFSTQLIKL